MSSLSLVSLQEDDNPHHQNNNAPQSPKIVQLVDSLVLHMLPDHHNNDQLSRLNMQRRCLKILGSRLAAPYNQNEISISDSIKKHLIRTHQSNDRALRCVLLMQKLNTCTVLHRKWATLYFLYAVSLQVAHTDDSAVEIPSGHLHMSQIPSSSTLNQSRSFSQSKLVQRDSAIAPSLAHQRSTMFSMNSMQLNTESTVLDAEAPIIEQRETTGFQIYLAAENTSYQVPELSLLKDLLFILQGIDGRFIKWDPSESQYMLDTSVGIPRPVRDLVHRISELGYLYKTITEYLATTKLDPGRVIGSVEQSFVYALQGEITQYFRLLSVIETSITKDQMTLRRLYMWSIDPAQRLRVMLAMIVSAKEISGGALIGMVHTYAHHGDVGLEGFVQHVLKIMCVPLFTMIKRWVFEGELVDVHGEFFVQESVLSDEQQWWQHKYSLRSEMIPGFIQSTLANKVLLIGKTLNYLRFQANDSGWVSDRVHVGLATDGLAYGDVTVFEGIIDAAFNVTTKRLIAILFDQFDLLDHLLALKRYLLMEQGDFVQCLIESLAPTLNKPATLLYRHELVGMLEQAIRSSNAQYSTVIERLDVRLIHTTSTNLGWDVFSLDYLLDSPLDSIVTQACMKTYIQLFTFLWQVKRVANILSGGWKKVKYDDVTDPRFVAAQHQCHRQWAEAMYFVNQYQYYLMYEVIECAWLEFQSSLCALQSNTQHLHLSTKIGDMDGLIRAHGQYLDRISTRITIPGTNAYEIFQLIFQCVLQLEAIRAKLDDLAGLMVSYQHHSVGTSRGLDSVLLRLQTCDETFKKHVGDLLVILSGSNDETLRNLKSRLNFNEYYCSDECRL